MIELSLTHRKTKERRRRGNYVDVVMFLLFLHLLFSSIGSAQTSSETLKNIESVGKIGRGQKTIERKTCQVPFVGKGLSEGDLVEIINKKDERVAIARLEKFKPSEGRLVATLLVGEEKCATLQGLALRVFKNDSRTKASSDENEDYTKSILLIAPRFQIAQTSLPGLALNKFLTPGYLQKGLTIHADGTFPRQPLQLGSLKLNFTTEVNWSTLATAPALDVVSQGNILGLQSTTSQILDARFIPRFFFLDERLWTGTVLGFHQIKNQSTLKSLNDENVNEQIFQVVRDVNGRFIVIAVELGFIIKKSAIVSILAGFGIKSTLKSPIIEDGDATNVTENLVSDSIPVFLGAKALIPIYQWIFSEITLDYKKFSFSIPLVNSGSSKASYELMSFAAGVGIRF